MLRLQASKGRTTIVIAHRLSTVRDSHCLFVIDKGVVAEHGSHDDLISRKGLFHTLVSKQVRTSHTAGHYFATLHSVVCILSGVCVAFIPKIYIYVRDYMTYTEPGHAFLSLSAC